MEIVESGLESSPLSVSRSPCPMIHGSVACFINASSEGRLNRWIKIASFYRPASGSKYDTGDCDVSRVATLGWTDNVKLARGHNLALLVITNFPNDQHDRT